MTTPGLPCARLPTIPMRGLGTAKARPGWPQRFDGAAFAALRLPCDARAPGPSHNSLRSLRSLRSDRCDESVHEARWRARPGALRFSALRRRATTSPGAPLRAATVLFGPKGNAGASRQAVPGGGDFWGDEKHSPWVGARSAHRLLTRRICPSAANAVSVASYAARPQAEHHSAVGAKQRPPQCEPTSGTACRNAQTTKTAHSGEGSHEGVRRQQVSFAPVESVPWLLAWFDSISCAGARRRVGRPPAIEFSRGPPANRRTACDLSSRRLKRMSPQATPPAAAAPCPNRPRRPTTAPR
jgi:hypothetical protein